MNVNTAYVFGVLDKTTEAMENKSMTSDQAKQEFIRLVSRQQLESCLTDPSLDKADLQACREMLQFFFGYQAEEN